MSDVILVKRAISGDKSAFCQLVEEYKEDLYRIAYSYVKNQHDALDIVGETVYKAFTSINTLKNPAYVKTWFTRILINCAINHLNKSKKIVYLDEDPSICWREEIDYSLHNEEQFDLHKALDDLDFKHKTIVILKYFEDLTLEQIAEVMDWPVSTVKTYLYRALRKLNVRLKEGMTLE